jgi:hypothetical protein
MLIWTGKDDHPADTCFFGEHGWVDEDVNVLTAIMNMTAQVVDGRGYVSFRSCSFQALKGSQQEHCPVHSYYETLLDVMLVVLRATQ